MGIVFIYSQTNGNNWGKLQQFQSDNDLVRLLKPNVCSSDGSVAFLSNFIE